MCKVTITPKGKAVWPRLSEPDTRFDSDGVFSCKLHVSEEDFKAFEASIKLVVNKAYEIECQQQGKQKLRLASSTPIRITEDGDYEIYAKQKAKVTTRSKGVLEFSVAAVDSSGKKIPMPQVGNGSELKMAVEVHPWYVSSQGFGYSLRLRAVQILDLIEFGAGGTTDSFGFGSEAGGYIGSGESLNSAFEVENEEDPEITQEEVINAPF